MPDRLTGQCWPTPNQSLLLRAACLESAAAREAWRAWRAENSLAGLESSSNRLLPLLYRSLRRAGVETPEMPMLRQVYRRAWGLNQQTLGSAVVVLQTLEAAGVQGMLLKGAPLGLLYYQDVGARPMVDFDIAVRPADAPRALKTLAAGGWRPTELRGDPQAQLDVVHSAHFVHEQRGKLDLHWHIMWQCCYDAADELLWARAAPMRVHDQPAWTLCAAHLLLHVCVHGTRWAAQLPIRWAADAWHILASGQVDWQRLLEAARALRLTLPLRDALAWLRAELQAPVPAEVLDALGRPPATRRERAFYHAWSTPPGRLGDLPLVWHHYATLAHATGRRWTPWGFGAYLQRTWEVESVWAFPRAALRVGAGRLAELLGGSGRAQGAGPAALD